MTNDNSVSAVIGALIGGMTTFISELTFRRSDSRQQDKHNASMFYYDLNLLK